ncbi:Plasma membrane low glucose sensor [Lithohypha guttulata]|uniref:Plasma membrane low glucose sensor n=1 Tax=Lithohypha guttulata TaxID=1690604 RepID=A0AAN7T2J6_9EURO|nr:Plasma membrane low glucose sensor [Lithohypha guttulata]KAK5086614.1 Plasma membrane low glucose sensor [Lithohypha guttulata]KAK5101620.1 Plasma membrane low glucose sensor [Lithohypha guttulata]
MGFMIKKPENVAGSAAPAILIGLFVSFGGVLFGYDTGTIGGILAMPFWRNLFSTGYVNPTDNHRDVTSTEKSEIVSILSAGTFFGALFSAPVADFLGRRWGMIFNTGVFTLGVILQTAATAIPMFVAGRFFAGLGVGLLSATIPLYQSETAPKWIRGAIVGCYQWAITIGLLLAAIVLNATKNRQDTGSYRIPVAVQFIFSIIMVVGMLILPETPRFLIKKGNKAKAAKALSKLRRLPVDHPALVEELAEIQANHEYEMSIGSASYLACFKPPIRKRQLTGMALQALQQLTGVNFIFYYGTSYFSNSGISNPFIVTMITSVVNVLSTIPGLWLVEVWGRRSLLMFGAVGMSFCQLIVAAVGTALPDSTAANKCLIAFVCIYIFFFACSWGPCAWVVTGESFPLKARAKGLSMTTASNWLLNFAIAYATPYMVDPGPGNANMGSKVFFVWGGFCVICTVFVYFCIYETKGLSLEQVDELYAKIPQAWKSNGFVPSVNFQDVHDLGKGGEARRHTLAELENAAVRRKSSAGVHHENYTEKV